MKKKFLSIILCLALSISLLAGCTDIEDKVSYSTEGAVSNAEATTENSEHSNDDSATAVSWDLGKETVAEIDTASPDAAGKAGSNNIEAWKNPNAHKKPSGGVEHSEEDYQHHLTVYCLDVGKADAFILFSGTMNAVIIDTGRDSAGDNILDILEEHGLTHISALIISHFDKDHVGGADYIIRETDVDQIYVTHTSKDSKQVREFEDAMELNNKRANVVREYTSFEVDGTTYEIFPPYEEAYGDEDNESNNSSLVVKVTNSGNSMLFTGDVENERLAELIASDDDLSCDILKMPHHGKAEKLTDEFVRKVAPQYAIITSSDKEPEDAEVTDMLSAYEIETYLTRNGEILIDTLPGEITIDQY